MFGKIQDICGEEVLPKLAHRGPDYSGKTKVGMATLGHTRLAIVDPSSGPQPLHGKHNNAITVNGEIYNHQALRTTYPASYQTNSDCEGVAGSMSPRALILMSIDGVFCLCVRGCEGPICILHGIQLVSTHCFMDGTTTPKCLWVASERKALLHCRDVVPFPPGHMWTQASEEPIPYYNPVWRRVPPSLEENRETVEIAHGCHLQTHDE